MTKEPASAILSLLLAKSIRSIGKIFITGRPEPRFVLGSAFRSDPQTEVLLLHEVVEGCNGDIKLFLNYISRARQDRSDMDVMHLGQHQMISILTSKAGGLVHLCTTVIKFVASISHKPKERLWLITSLPQSSAYEGKFRDRPIVHLRVGQGF